VTSNAFAYPKLEPHYQYSEFDYFYPQVSLGSWVLECSQRPEKHGHGNDDSEGYSFYD